MTWTIVYSSTPTGCWDVRGCEAVIHEHVTTNEELQSKLLYINNSIIVLLKMRGQ